MDETSDDARTRPADRVRAWLEDAVIGLDLCPFAASVYEEDAVRIVVDSGETFTAAVERTLDEASHLLETPPDEVATTLVIFTDMFEDFEYFLDGAAAVRGALEQSGSNAWLQVATFHPDYQFEGTEPDDLGNYTNRAPYPIYHLLRESQVTEAVDSHPDPTSIPDRNIERLQQMGREEIEAMWSRWSDPSEE